MIRMGAHLAPPGLGQLIASSQSRPILPQTDPTSSLPCPKSASDQFLEQPINDPEISLPSDVTANSQPNQAPVHTGTPHPSVHPRIPISAPTSPIIPARVVRIRYHPYTSLHRPKHVLDAILPIARGPVVVNLIKCCQWRDQPAVYSRNQQISIASSGEHLSGSWFRRMQTTPTLTEGAASLT